MRFLLVLAATLATSVTYAQEELREQCDEIDARVAGEVPTMAKLIDFTRGMLADDVESAIEQGQADEAEARIEETFSNSTVLSAADANKVIELLSAAAQALPALERLRAASEDFDTSC